MLYLEPHNLSSQSLDDTFFQPRNIGLGNTEQIRHFLLRLFLSVPRIDPKPELYDHLLALGELPDRMLKRTILCLCLHVPVNNILFGAQNI